MTAIGLSMTINGGAAPTVGTFGVVNPATADVFAQAPACSRGQLDEAMTTAQTAFQTWTADDKERRVILGEMGDALEAAATERGVDMTTLSLAWVLSRRVVTAAILGPRRPAHLEPGLRALDLELTDAEREELGALFA